MNKVNISVVIPCYNCADSISICVDSVVQQSYKVYEIILIDDGSTDNTLEVLHGIKIILATQSVKVIVITQSNAGPSAARNTGIEIANGEWIAFLDADDLWHNDKLLVQANLINSNSSIVAIGGSKGELRSTIDVNDYKEIGFVKLCFKNYFLTSSSIVKRSALREIRFNEQQKHSEDYRFFLDLLNRDDYGLAFNANLSCNIYGKRDFGEAGLSKDIWKMEQGELSNFVYLYNKGRIGLLLFLGVYVFSVLKFVRRVLLNCIHKILK